MKRVVLSKAVFFTALVTIILFSTVPVRAESTQSLPLFTDFVTAVTNAQAGVVRGVYVPGVLASPVIQQPTDNPGYVSAVDGTLTQFGMAAQYGSLGFLAHNTLAGGLFPEMMAGQRVRVVYGDGTVADYVIIQIDRYQALQPDSPTSNFVDLSNGVTYTATDVFMKYYAGGDHVTFQTCILQDGISSWGRLFIVAVPATFLPQSEDDSSGAAWK